MDLALDFRRPALTDRRAFAHWLTDWRREGLAAYRWIFVRAWSDFDWYVALCEQARTAGCPPELTVPLDVHWAFADETLVGELYVFLEPMNGENHIGYKVRPSYRRRGIASALLRYGLDFLRERGVSAARLTCGEANVASAAVIERAGGTRLTDRHGVGGILRRYVVPTRDPSQAAPAVQIEP